MQEAIIKDPIIILLSTFNGERYLDQQLKSILEQINVNLKLIIRDDGSSDSTKKIIKQYIRKYPEKINLIEGSNVGCVRSFFILCEYVQKYYPNVSYYGFADQDDIWLNNKIYSGLNALTKLNNDIPSLYFCQKKIVDTELNPIKIKNKDLIHANTFIDACIGYAASGCCMIFNKSSLNLFLKSTPEDMYLHDSWMYKTVIACGGQIIEDPKCLILYRQHENNVIGVNNRITKLKKRFKSFFKPNNLRSKEIIKIYNVYQTFMNEENKQIANMLINYKTNYKYKIRLLLSKKFNHKNTNSIFLKLSFLFNKF